ncbi:MAG: hypothetical protein JWQ20_3965 [Conexibacter sp.]|nr:hypothetical protein [Conexibacter sp.]
MLAWEQPLPVYFPDEALYAHLARSLADGEGFSWRGDPAPLRSALYVYLISPAWMVSSGSGAYQIAKIETALLSTLVAVPVWLLARELLARPLAILAVALSLAGTWMAGAGSLMTESVALPLATACLGAAVQALRRPASGWGWAALAFALLSAWARLQTVGLVPILLCALALDVARSGRDWRARLRRHRATMGVSALLLVLGGALAIVSRSTALGSYDGVLAFRPGATDVLRTAGRQLLELPALCAFLPVGLLVVLALRRAAWRDAALGPLLTVAVPATVLFALESGFFLVGYGVPWSIQRYVIYPAPLLLLLSVVALQHVRLVGLKTLAAVALSSPALLLVREVVERDEQRATFGTTERIRALVPSASTGISLLVVAVTLCLVAAVVTRSARQDPAVRPVVVGCLMLVVLVAQTATVWDWRLGAGRAARPTVLPDDVAWLDHHSHGPVAALAVAGSSRQFWLVDFFNRNITRFYAPHLPVPGPLSVRGGACRWTIADDGTTRFQPGCAPHTSEFFLNDPIVHLTFIGQRTLASDPILGRIVHVEAPVRLRSMVTMPCARGEPLIEPITLRLGPPGAPTACRPQVGVRLWLHGRGVVVVGIRGAPATEHTVAVKDRRYAIAPNAVTNIRIAVTAGRHDAVVDLDWAQRSASDAEVISVDLEAAGRRESLL